MNAGMRVLHRLLVGITLCIGEVIGVDQKTGGLKDDARPLGNFSLAICFEAMWWPVSVPPVLVGIQLLR